MKQKSAIVLLFLLMLFVSNSLANEKITLQLAWKHQFQFAGYYAALHKGYYKTLGLEVMIVEGGEGKFAREEVLNKRAQYGIAGAELILHRKDGDPFVVMAPIFQHSPSVLLARKDSGISNLQDLIGKRVMMLPGKKDADILAAFLNEGISLESFQRLDQTYNLEDLIDGRTDAVSSYLTNEPFRMSQIGVEPVVLLPQTYGVDFYSDCLFTTENEIKKHPQRAKTFLKASLKGWEYAMSHTEEIAELLITTYKVKKRKEHLLYEAEAIRKIMLPDLVQIGHMNPGRWKHIQEIYAKLGMIDPDFSIENFLYDPGGKMDLTGLKRSIGIAVSIIVLLFIGGLALLLFNRRLAQENKERTLAENALKLSQARYRKAQKLGQVGNWEYSFQSRKFWGSDEAKRIYGFDPDKDNFTPDEVEICITDKDRVRKALGDLIEKEKEYKIEFDIIIKDTHETRTIISIAELEKDANGKRIKISGVIQDITVRKQAEKALYSAHERFLTVLNSIDATVYVTDMETHEILFMNENMIKLFGRDMTGEICWEVLRGESAPCSYCPNDQLIDKNGKLKNVHVWQSHNPITDRWYVNYDRAIEWTDGTLVKLQIATDITKFKNMEDELRQSHKMESIGTLAGGIAHDFNNILSIILGNTELALTDIPEWSPASENIKEIKTASLRAKDVVRQLLSFSRKTEQSREPQDLSELIKESIKLLRSSISSDIQIVQKIPVSQNCVLADATQIHQVIINLCTNAAQAMSENGGILEIQLKDIVLDTKKGGKYKNLAPGTYQELIIKDTGEGIDPKIHHKIFDPYFTTKAFGKGTGMGLAVVHGIIENHNGSIYADSQPGKGSCFSVFLPVVGTYEKEAKPIKSENFPTGSQRILFVDDEESIVEMTSKMLSKLGYAVKTATTPLKALELLEKDPDGFDLVISDMTMPQMNGTALTKKIKALFPKIPVIICTGYSSSFDEGADKEIGISAYATKPVSMSKISKVIRKVLDEAD